MLLALATVSSSGSLRELPASAPKDGARLLPRRAPIVPVNTSAARAVSVSSVRVDAFRGSA